MSKSLSRSDVQESESIVLKAFKAKTPSLYGFCEVVVPLSSSVGQSSFKIIKYLLSPFHKCSS